MSIYKAKYLPGYEWLYFEDEDEIERLRFDGSSRVQAWEPLEMKRLHYDEDGAPLRVADFPCVSGGDMLAMSDKACAAIRGILQESGEILPLIVEGDTYWIYNVTRVIDVIDKIRTDGLRDRHTGELFCINKPVFKDLESLKRECAFKLSQAPGGTIYFGEAIVNAVRASCLKGVEFEMVA
ncbi:MAG: hypothetical protein R3F30_04430 [Planctomycetota bacterium]